MVSYRIVSSGLVRHRNAVNNIAIGRAKRKGERERARAKERWIEIYKRQEAAPGRQE